MPGGLVDLELLSSALFVGLLVALFFRGLRATWIMHRIYRSDPQKSPILRQFRDGSAVKVFAAAWFALLTLRALAEVPIDDGLLYVLRMGSFIVAGVVLDLPSKYLHTMNQIMNTEGGRRD